MLNHRSRTSSLFIPFLLVLVASARAPHAHAQPVERVVRDLDLDVEADGRLLVVWTEGHGEPSAENAVDSVRAVRSAEALP